MQNYTLNDLGLPETEDIERLYERAKMENAIRDFLFLFKDQEWVENRMDLLHLFYLQLKDEGDIEHLKFLLTDNGLSYRPVGSTIQSLSEEKDGLLFRCNNRRNYVEALQEPFPRVLASWRGLRDTVVGCMREGEYSYTPMSDVTTCPAEYFQASLNSVISDLIGGHTQEQEGR